MIFPSYTTPNAQPANLPWPVAEDLIHGLPIFRGVLTAAMHPLHKSTIAADPLAFFATIPCVHSFWSSRVYPQPMSDCQISANPSGFAMPVSVGLFVLCTRSLSCSPPSRAAVHSLPGELRADPSSRVQTDRFGESPQQPAPTSSFWRTPAPLICSSPRAGPATPCLIE